MQCRAHTVPDGSPQTRIRRSRTGVAPRACVYTRPTQAQGRVRHRDVASSAIRSVECAADLVAQVAARIPMPQARLTADVAAWAAFDALVEHAAYLLARALGYAATPELEALLGAATTADPVGQQLIRLTLDTLTAGSAA